MTSQKKSLFSRSVINLLLIVPTLFSVVTQFICLFEQEARAAGRSFIELILLLIVTTTLLISAWFSALAILFVYLTSWNLSWHLSLFIILILNILLLIITLLIISKVKDDLAFPGTVRLFKKES